MKLLLVNERLGYASSTFYTLDLGLELMARGDEIRLCTKGGELRELMRSRGLETLTARFNLFSYYKLLGFVREFEPDLIHIQNLRSVGLGQRLSSRLALPHVVTVHRVPTEPQVELEHPNLAGVIAVGEMVRAALVNEHGVPKNLIQVIRRGVDVVAFRPQPATQGDVDMTDQRCLPVLGSVGRLTGVKGHDTFLRAARLSLDQGVEAMFMIVGEGEEEGPLRALVKELRLEEAVTFLPHMPSRRELYRIFDIVVVPTLRGGVGATALEAMAMGKPVVATSVGETLQMIEHDVTGLLFPERDDEALAASMVRLIRQPQFARELGARAREFVCQEYALAGVVDGTREFYEAVQARLAERSAETFGRA